MTTQSRQDTIKSLETTDFDLVVVGGGIFGAITVWQAQKRGLKTALIEAQDYGHGTSANSFKVIHGGIRYLQHLDIPRILASSRERSAFMRMAPHLCEPLPIIIPTYGWGKLGMPFLGLGCLVYDLITLLRNRKITDKTRKIPFTRFFSRKNTLAHYPDLRQAGLTGACVFNDGRFYNPTRLVWAFIESAQIDGAITCNYLKAGKLQIQQGVVTGIDATDHISGGTVALRSRCIVNTTGPWAEPWLESALGEYSLENTHIDSKKNYSRDVCFVVDKTSASNHTLAVQGETADPDAVLSRAKRHLFLSPWRDATLVGVWHKVTSVSPDAVKVSKTEMQTYINEINSACPNLNLTLDNVRMCHAGLVPFGDEQKDNRNLSYGKRSTIVDHDKTDGIRNFITLIGLRYTMARGEGEKVLDLVEQKLGRPISRLKTDYMRLYSAEFENFEQYSNDIVENGKVLLSERVCRALAHNHGSSAHTILQLIRQDPRLATIYEGSDVTAAEVRYVCEHEQVESLSDVLLRRTGLATIGRPAADTLQAVLQDVAALKGWNKERQLAELAQLEVYFPPL